MAQISTINFSQLSEYFGRIDAEFYKPVSLNADKIIKDQKHQKLGHMVADGYRVVYESTKILNPDQIDYENDARFLQATNISTDGLWIEVDDIGYVNVRDWDRYPKGRIEHGEVLIEVKGQAEKVTIVQEYVPERTLVTGSVFKLSLKKDAISHEYLFAFFSSKYGKVLRDRTKVNTLIAYVSKPELYRIPVPIPNASQHDKISQLVKDSFNQQKLSKDLYTQATQLLEDALGLNNIEFKKEKSYTAYASEVASTRRMNAEYFSPTVKSILQQDFFKNSQPLGMIFQIIRGTTPKEYFALGVPVLKTKNVRVPEIDKERIADFVQSTKDLTEIRNQDLLLASMGVGSLGRMSYISNLEQSYVVDGTIRVLRPKPTTPENFQIPTLLFLSSKVGQELIYRGIVGSTGIISLPDDYLKKIPIPIFSPELCEQLTLMVSDSIEAKRESKELLEQAKHEVETLIEQAAQTA